VREKEKQQEETRNIRNGERGCAWTKVRRGFIDKVLKRRAIRHSVRREKRKGAADGELPVGISPSDIPVIRVWHKRDGSRKPLERKGETH